MLTLRFNETTEDYIFEMHFEIYLVTFEIKWWDQL